MLNAQQQTEYCKQTVTSEQESARCGYSDFNDFAQSESDNADIGNSEILLAKLAEITHDGEKVIKKVKNYHRTALSQIKKLSEYEIHKLKYRLSIERYRYSADPNEIDKHERDIKCLIREMRFQTMRALRFEKSDRRRYLKAMRLEAGVRRLGSSHQSDALNKHKAELLLLLEERESIERELSELYAEKYREYVGASSDKKHLKIKLNAARRAYKRYGELSKSVSKYTFSPEDKVRFFESINKSIELSSDIAVLKYKYKNSPAQDKSRPEQKRIISDKKRERARAKRNAKALLAKARRRTYLYGKNGIIRWAIITVAVIAVLAALFGIFHEPILDLIY